MNVQWSLDMTFLTITIGGRKVVELPIVWVLFLAESNIFATMLDTLAFSVFWQEFMDTGQMLE